MNACRSIPFMFPCSAMPAGIVALLNILTFTLCSGVTEAMAMMGLGVVPLTSAQGQDTLPSSSITSTTNKTGLRKWECGCATSQTDPSTSEESGKIEIIWETEQRQCCSKYKTSYWAARWKKGRAWKPWHGSFRWGQPVSNPSIIVAGQLPEGIGNNTLLIFRDILVDSDRNIINVTTNLRENL